ncbi:hypothetical protein IF2G_03528 [Cordyceps javanica]|nr:hypothetical protein IF2G_03528 [Cordyceps javanica]
MRSVRVMELEAKMPGHLCPSPPIVHRVPEVKGDRVLGSTCGLFARAVGQRTKDDTTTRCARARRAPTFSKPGDGDCGQRQVLKAQDKRAQVARRSERKGGWKLPQWSCCK